MVNEWKVHYARVIFQYVLVVLETYVECDETVTFN